MKKAMSTEMSFDTAPTVREAQEFYAASDAVPPNAVTACVGWTDAAARLLLLWGRRPEPEHRVTTDLDPERLRQLQAWLCV